MMRVNGAFTKQPGDLLAELKTNAVSGLRDGQVLQNRQDYGANAFHQQKPPSLGRRIWEAAREPMILMLVFAGLITFGVNLVRFTTMGEADFLECAGIFAAILLSVVITVAMEGKSAKAFDALRRINEDTLVRLVRDGEVVLLPQKELVTGDILCVETGDRLPADARLLESSSLLADESALTGESMPVEKNAAAVFTHEMVPVAERSNMLYSGSYITSGTGRAVITGVGEQTEFGKIAQELSATETASTPLQEKMAVLGKRITIIGAAAAALVFFIQLAILFSDAHASLHTISEAFITSIVLIVAAVPEGLPTIVAVSLSINIIKMSRQNALVKKMIACETVGCINVICSDKTGTLTENRMTVREVYNGNTLLSPEALVDGALLQNFCINSTADIHWEGDTANFIGNPTECALLTAAHKAGLDYRALRTQANIAHIYPFSSEEKHMTTVVAAQGGYLAYTKGNPEQILLMCTLTSPQREKAEQEILCFQQKSYRVIAFAHKKLPLAHKFAQAHEEIESGMVFDGFVAIADPLRNDVYESVENCRKAGIGLKILTGDNLVTATAIANELGILSRDNLAVEAKELETLTDEELAARLPAIRVIARSTPVIKMRVVNALKAQGNVVAVTGDGINDAPALKNADVGIAMGISGTEVSKEASDIVLLDDSFSTIVKAVQWGRGIYENFQRFIQFQLTVNLSSVVVVLASILMGFSAPFSALQLLWVNIIMDGPPALTLGLEPIRGDLLARSPTSRGASIVSKEMLARIATNGLFISAVFLLQQSYNFIGASPEQAPTVLFTLFVVFQLFNAFNSRELSQVSIFRNLLNNRLMLATVGLTFCLQIVITQYGSALFGTTALPLAMWVKIIGMGFSVILVSEALKLLGGSLSKKVGTGENLLQH